MPNQSLPPRLAELIVGPSGPTRTRYIPSAVALASYLLFALVQQGEVSLGLMQQQASNWHTLSTLLGASIFFVLVRSGWSRRLAVDPSLTLPQMLFGMASISWSYAITGPARGALISLMILIILFGVFSLKPQVARRLSFAGFCMLAMAMAWRVTSSTQYDPRVELIHFIFAGVVMLATSSLAITVGRLRADLTAQKKELKTALHLNRELATRDALTGLLNRRAIGRLLEREQSRTDRDLECATVALLDIDWFKRINDQHGHSAGDAVLQRFATLILSELRAGDELARWGGEEFLLLVPATDLDAARIAIDRIRDRVADADFGDISPTLTLTFSAGVAQFTRGEHFNTTIDRADRALYRAKEAGRNRVEAG